MALRAELAERRPAGDVLARRTAETWSEQWVSLADAARALQAAQRGTDLDCLARGLSQSDDDLLAFWAHRVAQIGVPVHGRRIMATRTEIVPRAEMSAGRLLNDASRLNPMREQPTQDFCALQVRRRDLDTCLQNASRDRVQGG